ncbi:MAG: hypothetical protein KPEEDBHJ_02075 [Anaerolineales bacterium]|nr:hypothetical protein [Anaerolineales bacterium]
MSKYRSSALVKVKERNKQPHYIWRGIGCVMMIIVPIISMMAGALTIDAALAKGYTIPYQLLGTPRYPDIFYKSTGLMTLLSPITNTQHFYAKAAAGIIYMILLGGLFSFSYAVVYRMVGPSRYGPLDEPPPKFRAKTYKR